MTMRLLVACLLVFASGACAPTETGNPSIRATLRLVGRSSDPSVVAPGSSRGGIGVLELWISLDRATLRSCNGEEHSVDGRLAADLVTGEHELSVPTGTFCNLDLDLAPSADQVDPEVLAGRSAVTSGERSDGVPFVLATETPLQIALAADSSFVIEQDELLFLSFDLAVWLNGVDLDSAAPGADGTITIDEASNPTLLDHFVAQAPAAASLEYDADHDHVLDPEEIADPAASHHP